MHITRYQRILVAGICLIFMLATVCSALQTQTEVTREVSAPDVSSAKPEESGTAWAKITLTDAVSGEHFTINDIAKQGKPVILHTFAVWCSACLMQLRETEGLVADNPDAATVIGIDLDPNENQDLIKRHIEKNKFPGMYVAAPKDLSAGLIGSFGTNFFTDLPQTVIICNRTITKLGTDGECSEKRHLRTPSLNSAGNNGF